MINFFWPNRVTVRGVSARGESLDSNTVVIQLVSQSTAESDTETEERDDSDHDSADDLSVSRSSMDQKTTSLPPGGASESNPQQHQQQQQQGHQRGGRKRGDTPSSTDHSSSLSSGSSGSSRRKVKAPMTQQPTGGATTRPGPAFGHRRMHSDSNIHKMLKQDITPNIAALKPRSVVTDSRDYSTDELSETEMTNTNPREAEKSGSRKAMVRRSMSLDRNGKKPSLLDKLKKKLGNPAPKPKDAELLSKSRERRDSGEDATVTKDQKDKQLLLPGHLPTPPPSPGHSATSYYKQYFETLSSRDGTASDSEVACSSDREHTKAHKDEGSKQRRTSLNLSRRSPDVATECQNVPWAKAAIHKRGQAAKKAASEVARISQIDTVFI